MSAWIKVRLRGTYEIEVPAEVKVDLAEYADWCRAGGFEPDFRDATTILDFVNHSQDIVDELSAEFPKPDVDVHSVEDFHIDGLELL